MNVLHNFPCIYHDFDATVVKQKLGDNIVTVTNNVLHTFLKIFAVVKFLPCFPIIADSGGYRLTAPLFIRPFRLTAPLFIRLMDAPPHFRTAPLDSPPHFRTAPLDSPPHFRTAPLDSPPHFRTAPLDSPPHFSSAPLYDYVSSSIDINTIKLHNHIY